MDGELHSDPADVAATRAYFEGLQARRERLLDELRAVEAALAGAAGLAKVDLGREAMGAFEVINAFLRTIRTGDTFTTDDLILFADTKVYWVTSAKNRKGTLASRLVRFDGVTPLGRNGNGTGMGGHGPARYRKDT